MDIKEFIVKNLAEHPADIVNLSMRHYQISRPAVLKHLNNLIQNGKIHVEGKTKDRCYSLTNEKTNSQGSSVPCSTINTGFVIELESELSIFVRKVQLIIGRHTQYYVDLRKLVGTVCMSRDQAKRVLVGLNQFKTVVLDFKDVSTVGQGFVDEVFRVYQNQHPDITFTPTNMNENVEFMVKRGLPRESK